MGCDPDRLKDLVQGSGLSYRQNSRSYIFDCPKCGKKNKLFVMKTTGQFICWYCAEIDNFRGKPEYAFTELLQLPVHVVREKLYGYNPSTVLDPLDVALDPGYFFGDLDEIDIDAVEVIPTQAFPWHFYPIAHPMARKGRLYLEGRGIPVEVATRYDVRYSPIEGRVIFPVKQEGRLVGWQARLVGPSEIWSEEDQDFIKKPKVLTWPTALPRERLLMFAERLKGCKYAVITEGPISGIKLDLCGANVATMGKAVSPGQIAILRNLGITRVYLALDPDAARETSRLVRELSDMEVFHMDSRLAPTPGEDPGELAFEDGLELFRNARREGPGSLFIFLG